MSVDTSPPKVVYRRLGTSGLKVSVPIIGAQSYGSREWLPWVLEKDEALPLLKKAWDLGVNTIDTANLYSNGVSEQIIADFIKEYSIPRHKLVILTKCYGLMADKPGVLTYLNPQMKALPAYQNQYGLSRKAIFNAVDASLERLGTSYIDLLQIHRYDSDCPVEETMKALHDLIQSGKVRYIGACSMRTWQFSHMNHVAEKHNWTKFISMQNEHSLLYREEEHEMIPYCNFEGIGLIPWGPLSAGQLCRPLKQRAATMRGKTIEGVVLSEADEAIINRVEEISKKKGITMAQVATLWSLSKVSSPIIGVSSISHLEESIACMGLSLTEDEIKYLEEPYVPKVVRNLELYFD